MRRAIISVLVVTSGLLLNSCNTTDPPEGQGIGLKLENVSCTEAWITLTTTNLQLPTTVTLEQNDQVHSIINLVKTDTLIYIDSLLPNRTYQYQALNNQYRVSSNELSVTTLDTTSQNFTFEIFEFGDGFSSSYFNDVWIFNPDDIWVCGNVFTNDSTDGNLYHWNGSYWKAHRLNFVDMEGIWGMDTIMYLASGGLWLYDRDTLIRQNIQGNFEPGQAVHKLWGSSRSNIYGVGPWGTIVYYNGVRWTKIDFDTQWYFYEITGNKESGVGYAVARNANNNTIIIELTNSITEIIYDSQENPMGFGSWTIHFEDNQLLLSYGNIWSFNLISNYVKELIKLPTGLGVLTINSCKGNDIYYYGDEGAEARLVHFNGVNYKIFNIPQIDPDNYGGIHAINDLAVSVGFTNNKAYLILIRRGS